MRLIDADAFKAYMRGALEQTRRCYPDGGEWAEAVTEEFCRDIDEQPTIEPQRKKGEWIYNSPVTMKCNQCGLVIKDWDWHRFKYCPNCGADMRGEQNG